MKRFIATAGLLALCVAPALAVEPTSEEERAFYSLGVVISQQLGVFDLNSREGQLVQRGLADGLTGTPLVEVERYRGALQELVNARRARVGERLEAPGREFLEKAAKEPGAVTTPSGMVFRSLKDGTGASPAPVDTVKTHYRGTLIDGKEFDSSYARNQPIEFSLGQVIKCWVEGLGMMKPGGKARLVCPSALAYGERGSPPAIPPRATLVFEVELLEVHASQAPAAAPEK